MPKPEHKLTPAIEPDYDVADIEHEEITQPSYDEAVDPDCEATADPDYDDSVQAEYVAEVIDPEYEEGIEMAVLAEPEPRLIVTSWAAFAFEVGRAVVPLTQQQPYPVVWRGHLKERHPATGLVQRVPVYRLADGYWDCYREEELQVAGKNPCLRQAGIFASHKTNLDGF